MRNFWEEPQERKINKKKIAITTTICILLVILIVTTILYIRNENIRKWIDKNILRKEVMQNNLATIELIEENSNIYAFNKYIGILNKNKFDIYNVNADKEKTLDIEITNPLFDSENRFLIIGEKDGQKIYFIKDKELIWDTNIEGEISQIYVNKNGYVAIIIANTSHKNVIATYSPEGEELFKTFLSKTRAIDVSISNDNKYLAVAEIDASGTLIQSNVKIISIEKAQTKAEEAVEKIYNGNNDNKLLTSIQYQEKNKLICMYTDSINIINEDTNEELTNNENKKIAFSSIRLHNTCTTIEEKSSGLFTADSIVHFINTTTKEEKTYTTKGVAKEIYSSHGSIIALNLGAEIEFVNTNGWINKKYIASQEITNIVLSDTMAGIIFRDKVEIVKF